MKDAETYPEVDGRIAPQPDIEDRGVEPAQLATLRNQVTVPGGETAAPEEEGG